MRRSLTLAFAFSTSLVAAGCNNGNGAGSDMTVDLGADASTPDLAKGGTPDLTVTPTDAHPADIAMQQDGPVASPDLGLLPDLVFPLDLKPPVDMSGPLFGPAQTIPIGMGAGPYAVVARDVNLDTHPDLVVTDLSSNQVGCYLGKGDGTFQPVVTTSVTAPRFVAVSDINADTHPDLVVSTASGIVVLTGNGDCTFNAGTVLMAGTSPRAVVTADFDNDGFIDAAVANRGTNNVDVFAGNGSATLTTPPGNYTVGTSPYGLVRGDFNSDGFSDLAVTNTGDGTASVLINNGPGLGGIGFKPAVTYTVGSGAEGIAAADFNGDLNLDLVAVNFTANTASYLAGKGTGLFASSVAIPVGMAPTAVATADFDANGANDFVTANASSNDISVVLGNGNGTFRGAIEFPAGTYPDGVATADFNGDAMPDVAVVNFSSADIGIFINQW